MKNLIDFMRKIEKWTNKENGNHYDAQLILQNTNGHSQYLHKISNT